MLKYLNPRKYIDKIKDHYYMSIYNADDVSKEEMNKFEEAGFNYETAVQKLDAILTKRRGKGFDKKLDSVHWLLFACISSKYDIRNILELGTFDGETAAILAELFPAANIVTVDLPYDDPIFGSTYSRDSDIKRKKFIETQQKNLLNDRIKFIQKNSFFLNDVVSDKFDLIWVDAGHLYPEVAWDICNAYHLCNAGGFILFDDVIPESDGLRNGYVSPDSYCVLEYVASRSDDVVAYFLKREDKKWSAHPFRRKYVAIMNKQDRSKQ